MPKNSILKHALANSMLTAMYVILIALFFSHAEQLFGHVEKTALIPMGMLLLFVFSASVCGALFLGRPVVWYLDGNKKEAMKLFGFTVLFFFLVLIIVFIALYAVNVA